MSKLLIVESPAKARTIAKYLDREFKVQASVGHVVDLPRKQLGVDLKHDFRPTYEVMPEKKKAVEALKKAAADADEIYLAPDPDREGEAIAWHIADLLKKSGKPMRRVLFNEITRQAVLNAINQAGELDQNRFEAQQARRILDRLVGYQISPLISRKFKSGLSAGRVQSVAVRLVVERERAIRAFTAREYWSLEARLSAKLPPEFKARLVAIDQKSIELPERFDRESNTYVPIDLNKNIFISEEKAVKDIVEAVSEKPFVVGEVVRQERKRNPAPPFITSTLQQEAARRLGFTAKKTMALAQQLYEGLDVGEGAVGLITYMRTDSPRVAAPALDMVRDYIAKTYGKEFLPDRPRLYKSPKRAQEAHEAVRPTAMERTPEAVKKFLSDEQLKLYELIFRRFVASQMEPAVYDQTTIEIPVDKYLFRATGRVVKFKGFLAVYEEATEDNGESQDDLPLPEVSRGDRLELMDLMPEQHSTKPPPRFTEASLVRELEERGVGRPSTYAQILSTIQDRKYVVKEQKRFAPTPLGETINDIMVAAFPDIVDIGFTAQMERDLDRVEEGEENWLNLLRGFYGPFEIKLKEAGRVIDEFRKEEPTDLPCPLCERELLIKMGRNGEFLGCSAYPECNYTTDFERDHKGEITPHGRPELELECPECKKPLQIKQSRGREFLGCTGYPDCKFTANFEKDEEGNIKPIKPEKTETEIKCEQCGKPMVIRKTRKGGLEFLACSGYPKCRNAMDFTRDQQGEIKPAPKKEQEETGIKCEQCGKQMIIKTARKTGKEFMACSGYPKCKNAADFIREQGKIKPVAPGEKAGDCEKCGRPMVLKIGRFGTFFACSGYPECKHIQGQEKAGEGGKNAKTAGKPLPEEPPCEKCGQPMIQREGRFGPFIACSGYPQCKNIRKKAGDKPPKKAPSAPAKKKKS